MIVIVIGILYVGISLLFDVNSQRLQFTSLVTTFFAMLALLGVVVDVFYNDRSTDGFEKFSLHNDSFRSLNELSRSWNQHLAAFNQIFDIINQISKIKNKDYKKLKVIITGDLDDYRYSFEDGLCSIFFDKPNRLSDCVRYRYYNDSDALRNDWKVVGHDINKALLLYHLSNSDKSKKGIPINVFLEEFKPGTAKLELMKESEFDTFFTLFRLLQAYQFTYPEVLNITRKLNVKEDDQKDN
jgi:ABC-type multidrug transport system fused ATPase/permease subunit